MSRSSWLARKIRIIGQTATDELQEGIAAQGVGIILILVATSNLKVPLTDEGMQ